MIKGVNGVAEPGLVFQTPFQSYYLAWGPLCGSAKLVASHCRMPEFCRGKRAALQKDASQKLQLPTHDGNHPARSEDAAADLGRGVMAEARLSGSGKSQ